MCVRLLACRWFRRLGESDPSSFRYLLHNRYDVNRVRRVNKQFTTSSRRCAMLSPSEVSTILRQQEFTVHLDKYEGGVVTSFDTTQLAANRPVEDRRSAATCLRSGGLLFGVFDGHAGTACSQAVSERLFDYIATSILPYDRLAEIQDAFLHRRTEIPLLKWHRNPDDYISVENAEGYKKSLGRFVNDSLAMNVEDDDLHAAIELAFERLDEDISSEARALIGGRTTVYQDATQVALSGSCACVAYINGSDVWVANVGDSRAIIGRKAEMTHSGWIPKALSHRHSGHNTVEIDRIRKAHPHNESAFLIKNNRLLSELAPLRAFGDVKYKWHANQLRALPNGRMLIPRHYYTPPYLVATPEIIHHRLTPQDKFLVIATDGLWDFMTKEKTVQLVGDHISGRETLEAFKVRPTSRFTLSDINSKLKDRKSGLASRPIDDNVATHLVRHALGDSEKGISHGKLSAFLSLPHYEVRDHRDDITIYVIFFDTEKKRSKSRG
ncbi:pyruvate dehydrogenase [acetyl-transferring]-phosphatase 1, mitochondrial-like [Saccoglossus kowalevskii]|uniref:Pyruvate dehydrogenase [acetyl-transferring]-phosphatase 1-like n=1 Tax=Saccoglossus kowalevskii TaxID=10224 RepID=A0ABM0H1X7_SACKO|nr:PREDICTED: Pyruvate dehydrogenase [acetyl-transferring]-phosphatase 1-like [Saccoglossus kowalevskii]